MIAAPPDSAGWRERASSLDDDARLTSFTDKYDLAPVTADELLADERIAAVLVHSKSKDWVPLALRVLDAGTLSCRYSGSARPRRW